MEKHKYIVTYYLQIKQAKVIKYVIEVEAQRLNFRQRCTGKLMSVEIMSSGLFSFSFCLLLQADGLDVLTSRSFVKRDFEYFLI